MAVTSGSLVKHAQPRFYSETALAHNRLSHSSGTVRNLSLKPPNTSENFKRCASCSQTLAPFSHTSQTNWPWAKTYPVALNYTKNTRKHIKSLLKHLHTQRTLSKLPTTLQVAFKQLRNKMLCYRQVPNLSQTNLNEIYASQTASIERGGHPDMEFLQIARHRSPHLDPVELVHAKGGKTKAASSTCV